MGISVLKNWTNNEQKTSEIANIRATTLWNAASYFLRSSAAAKANGANRPNNIISGNSS